MSRSRKGLALLGPGLLFAATSIGVSHLVQSTRAGATYGLMMLLFVLLACVAKYPSFRFAPDYTLGTGTSILEGYRKQGKWALCLYGFAEVASIVSAPAALALITAGLATSIMGIDYRVQDVATALAITTVGVVLFGRYRWVERITKVLLVIMAISTVAATLAILPKIDWSGGSSVSFAQLDARALLFMFALIGWMPSPLEVSVIHSLWSSAKARDSGIVPPKSVARFDFDVGFFGAIAFAFCFGIMGAALIFGTGEPMPPDAAPFAARLIGLYEQSLGEYAGPVVGIAAFTVMYSTLLAYFDGNARALATLVARFRTSEASERANVPGSDRRMTNLFLILIAISCIAVTYLFASSLSHVVDFATTTSFVVAPIIAFLNYRAILSEEVPTDWRPGPAMRRYARICVGVLAVASMVVLASLL